MNKIISKIHKTVSYLNFITFVPIFVVIFVVPKQIVINYHIIDILITLMIASLFGMLYLSKMYLNICEARDEQIIKISTVFERYKTLSEMKASPDIDKFKKEIYNIIED